MPVTLKPGEKVTIAAAAQYEDPQNPGQFLDDPNATIHWQESSNGAVVALTDNGTTAGKATATFTYVADGTADVQAFASDPSGHTTPLSTAVTVTCATPVQPSTDATQVVLTDPGQPDPAA